MKFLLCTSIIATAFLGAYANLKVPQSSASVNSVVKDVPVPEAEKQAKLSLFGAQIDVNLNKNGTLIPVPSFVSLNTSYGTGVGAGGSLIVPLAFPLGLLFPNFPPLNLTLGINANKNVALAVNAGAGDISSITEPESSGSGWASPTTTPGWAPPPPTTTPGWAPPPTTSGWAPPPTTPGWGPGWKKIDEKAASEK